MIREAVRSQIVGHGLTASAAIAAELQESHARVVRVLQRFEAAGALRLLPMAGTHDAVHVVPESITTRFGV